MNPGTKSAFLFALGAMLCGAEVRVATLISSHMVVQRGLPVHIWGTAAPDEQVRVSFRDHTGTAKADELGRWSLYLPPGEAGGPFELVIAAGNTIRLGDILAGDVWIAAGQSNMEWPVRWAADPGGEKAAANYSNIRLVRTMHRVREYPVDDFVGATWTPCTPESVDNFSAVAYHFARILHERLGVPIGVVQAAWGGTPAEAWTSLRAISSEPGLMPIFAEWARVTEGHEEAMRRHRVRLDDWARAAAKARDSGAGRPERPELRTGPGGPWTPAGLFNGMLAPLTRIPVRGVIWYQGESNTSPERAPLYRQLFPALIRDWRRAWGQGDFPFFFVQLANFRAAPESMWPEVREAQREALSLTRTAMVVTTDIGTPGDIHPRNKRTVAERLALAARALVYGEQVEYSGPLFRQAAMEGSQLRVWFDHAGGLAAREGEVRGFELAGPDEKFVPALARIEGSTAIVSSSRVAQPRYVRYAWAGNPDANLFNGAGLPASPFRTKP